MATSVYFNGKMRTLPGVYSTITSGQSDATRNLDYGTVLLIDTGKEDYGAGWGGGSGIQGENLQGKDAVYEFTDLSSFRQFVKGGMFWKCAEALFTPDPYNPDAVGISKLLYVRACTTKPTTLTISTKDGKGTFAAKTIDEGINALGVVDEGTKVLKKGYAYTIEKGVEDETAVIVKFWLGSYTGDYTDPVTGQVMSYNELTVAQSDPILVCQSSEVSTMQDLINWAQKDENFGARFILDMKSSKPDGNLVGVIKEGDGSGKESDLTNGYQVSTGGNLEEYTDENLEEVLKQITDVEYNIVFTDRIEDEAESAKNKKVLAHRNTVAKFDKFFYVGAYSSAAKFSNSLAVAQNYNSAWVVCVHGGIGTASDYAMTKIRWWGVFYNLCQVIGRVSGKPPYIPVTNKTIGGDKLQHIPDENQQEKAVKAGLVVAFPNPYLRRFCILQGVTTLQDNALLFNKKGDSFSIQFMRILAQLNKECVVNASIDLLGDENGVNINTLSKGALETWTINFLQQRVATDNQDNLIQRFQNVVATRIDDYYDVTYEVVVNSEITKLFFTGFVLRS